MTPRDEDEAWQDIVDRYDEEATGIDVPDAEAAAPEPTVPELEDPAPWNPIAWEDEGTFVPPTPEPVPLPEPPRLIAWIGVIGAPLVLLVFLLGNWPLPSWATTLLIVWFVSGFGFLVATMDNRPRDPGDDGAVI